MGTFGWRSESSRGAGLGIVMRVSGNPGFMVQSRKGGARGFRVQTGFGVCGLTAV